MNWNLLPLPVRSRHSKAASRRFGRGPSSRGLVLCCSPLQPFSVSFLVTTPSVHPNRQLPPANLWMFLQLFLQISPYCLGLVHFKFCLPCLPCLPNQLKSCSYTCLHTLAAGFRGLQRDLWLLKATVGLGVEGSTVWIRLRGKRKRAISLKLW